MTNLAERLQRAREAAGFATAQEGAARVGVNYYTYAQHENGTRGFPAKKAELYARAYRVDMQWLLTGRGQMRPGKREDFPPEVERVTSKTIPILGFIQAGVWAEVDEYQEPLEYIAFPDPQYQRTKAFALIVRGESANKVYPDGTVIIAAPASDTGVRDGDFVVIQRRDVTGKVETTLKQAQSEGGGVVFYPRSTDPRHQVPFVPPPHDESNQDGWEVTGVVIGSYHRAPARTGALISV